MQQCDHDMLILSRKQAGLGGGRGSGDGAGKLLVPGRHTNLDNTGSTVLAVGAVGVVWTIFFFNIKFVMARYKLKYCLKEPFKP